MKNAPRSRFVADPILLEALERQAVQVPCTEDRVLFRQGEECSGLYMLRSGEAILGIHSAAGRCIASFHAAAGSLMGLPAVLADQPYSATATARQGSNVSFVPRNEFVILLESNPSLYPMVLRVIAAQIQAARSELSSL